MERIERAKALQKKPRMSFRNYMVGVQPETAIILSIMLILMLVMYPEWRVQLIIVLFLFIIYFSGALFGKKELTGLGDEIESDEGAEGDDSKIDRSNIF